MRPFSTSLALGLLWPLSLAAQEEEPAVSLAFGAALTSNYISSGVTQTGDKPAFQPYVELSRDGVYGGIWLSNVDFGDDDMLEIDLYAGYRGDFGNLSYDLSYYRYLYDDSGDCCGEIVATLGYTISDELYVEGEIDHDIEAESTYFGFGGALQLPFDLELSAYFGTTLGGPDVDWNAGVTRYLTDTVSLDLRYHDSNLTGPRVNLTLSWDTDWASLMASGPAE